MKFVLKAFKGGRAVALIRAGVLSLCVIFASVTNSYALGGAKDPIVSLVPILGIKYAYFFALTRETLRLDMQCFLNQMDRLLGAKISYIRLKSAVDSELIEVRTAIMGALVTDSIDREAEKIFDITYSTMQEVK